MTQNPHVGPNDIIVGLDIGTTKIACFVGQLNEHGKVIILGSGKSESLGVKRGVVSNIQQTVDSIRKAVDEAETNSGISIERVNVGIAGQHIRSQQRNGMITRKHGDTEICRADIDELIRQQQDYVNSPGEEIIHVMPQEYTVDGETGIKEPIGMNGVRLEAMFHVITGQVNAIRNIYRCITKAGLEVDQLVLEPLASSSAVLSDDELEAGVALVDIGGGTTDIAIFQDHIIRHTAVIAMGGNIVTEDIRKGCTIMMKQAEKLKQHFGSAIATEMKDNEIVCIPGLRGGQPREISRRNLAAIIEARMQEIIELVYYEIKNSGYEDELVGGIVLTGGGSMLKHAAQLFEYVTGISCRIGYPNEHLSELPENEITSPSFSTGVGLVLKGYEDSIEHTNDEEPIRDELEVSPTETIGANFFNAVKRFFEADDEVQN
jgi:cell division protein FtsA